MVALCWGSCRSPGGRNWQVRLRGKGILLRGADDQVVLFLYLSEDWRLIKMHQLISSTSEHRCSKIQKWYQRNGTGAYQI